MTTCPWHTLGEWEALECIPKEKYNNYRNATYVTTLFRAEAGQESLNSYTDSDVEQCEQRDGRNEDCMFSTCALPEHKPSSSSR